MGLDMPSNTERENFARNNLKANALMLEGRFDLDRERDVKVASFSVSAGENDETVYVDEGKYKSALLLLYLAELAEGDQFFMNDDYREIVREYYGDDLCADAETNEETTHTTIRDLLSDGQVIVTINRK